jgi:hypothetical protein
MTATYTIKANEIDDFLRLFKPNYFNHDVTITIETMQDDSDTTFSQATTNARILNTVAVENSGKEPYKTMTVAELETLAQ